MMRLPTVFRFAMISAILEMSLLPTAFSQQTPNIETIQQSQAASRPRMRVPRPSYRIVTEQGVVHTPLAKMGGMLNKTGQMMSYAGFALAIIDRANNPFRSVKGIDCEDGKQKINQLICRWEDRRFNNKVQCSVERTLFPNSEESCGAMFDVMFFTIDDKESRKRFKDADMLTYQIPYTEIFIGDGIPLETSIEEFAVEFMKNYKVKDLRIGKDFRTATILADNIM